MTDHWVDVRDINPQPWTAPSATRGKGGRIVAIKGGQNEAYQKALQEEMSGHKVELSGDTPLHVKFYFWRSTEMGNQADATNLLKATEDALQGYLYGNDRHNRHVEGCIIEQSPTTEPRILIHVDRYKPPFAADFDPTASTKILPLGKVDHHSDERTEDEVWRSEHDPAAEF